MGRGKVKPDEECKVSWLNVRLTTEERKRIDARALAESTPDRKVTPTDLARRGIQAILAMKSEARGPEAVLAQGSFQETVRKADMIRPVGVGLKDSEIEKLDAIAAESGISRNALMRFALIAFIQAYGKGYVTIPVEHVEHRRVIMPKE